MTTPSTNTQLVQWAQDVLTLGGWPTSTSNMVAMVAWGLKEGGWFHNSCEYNVLNTGYPMPGSRDAIGHLQAYSSYGEGLQATVNTLTKSSPSFGYAAIVAALSAGTSTSDVLIAVQQSSWDADHEQGIMGLVAQATTLVTGTTTQASPNAAIATSLFINPDGTTTGETLSLSDPVTTLPDPSDDLSSHYVATTTPLAGKLVLADGTEISQGISSGSVELSVMQVSQITVTVEDPHLFVYATTQPKVGDVVTWGAEEPWIISRIELGQGEGTEQWTLYLRSFGGETLNFERASAVQGGSSDGGATAGLVQDLLNTDCAVAPGGLRRSFKAKVDSVVSQVPLSRQMGNIYAPTGFQTSYAMYQSAATGVRSWFFEDQGTFYFGRPSWLITIGKQFKVGWLAGWPEDPGGFFLAQECPQVSVDRDELPWVRRVRVLLDNRQRGEQVRPGMRLNLKGLGPQWDIAYIVTDVSYNLDGGITPVTIDAQEAIDPYPTDSAPLPPGLMVQNPTADNLSGSSAIPGTASAPEAQPIHGSFLWPVVGFKVSQEFGSNPNHNQPHGHPGIDLACPTGTPIAAASDGTVTNTATGFAPNDHSAGSPPLQGYGNAVMVDCGNGITAVYGHLETVLVNEGDKITQGQEIGVSDNTGFSTGPHLHFELRKNGTPIDPRTLIMGDPFTDVLPPAAVGIPLGAIGR